MMLQTMLPAAYQGEKNKVSESKSLFNENKESPKVSLMTPLGLIEGDILGHLESRARTVLQDLIHNLGWPAHLILMASGSLIRQGYARAIQQETEVFIEAVMLAERRDG